jgi:O-succinylbenzoic acid--CoA ligase
LTENSQNLTAINVTYSSDFKEKSFVESSIDSWVKGADDFTLFTSGSTGIPKKIRLPRALLIWSIESTKAALNLSSDESVLCCLPVQKTGGFMQLIRSLHFGWNIHFINPTANSIKDTIRFPSHFSLTSLTPSQIQAILDHNPEHLSSFKNILIGGAALSSLQEKKISELSTAKNINFWETYGMTETASHVALRKVGVENYFQTQTGVQVTLDDEQLCIAIPELDFFIKTNDIAILHDDSFQILGRSDDVINSGGIKIHPALIEPQIKKVLESASINRAFYVSKKKDTTLGEKAVLVIEGPPITDKTYVLELLKRDLPLYHNPKEIIFVDQIAYTDTGKVKRVALE